MFDWFKNRFRKRVQRIEDLSASADDAESDFRQSDGVTGDSPIRSPKDDIYGFDPFARAIAKSISSAAKGVGIVFAVNGAWGSGKSSAVNLILHHLAGPISSGELVVTAFNPWWFAGTETITLSFVQELRAVVGKSLDERAREAMATLGSRLSSAGPLLGGIATLLATPATGAAVAGGASLLEKLTHQDTTVQEEHEAISKALARQEKRFLIVLDDIDRLNTDDALLIFKLVKSVGRLPNVSYLMAFDRHLAEKMVAERFPAEGTSYLDKIVQGAFELPIPDPDELRNQLLQVVDHVMGSPPEKKMQRFFNIFYDAVTPSINTPRDVVRLSNAVSVSWHPVANDLDCADFFAIEAMRLFLPSVYQAVKTHPELLTGNQRDRSSEQELRAAEYDEIFLTGLSSRDKEIAKRALRRLFPRLDAIWSRGFFGNADQWQRDRLICSPEHFATYFAFAVIDNRITSAESDAMVAAAGTPGATARALRNFVVSPRRKGGTRAALALEELQIRANDIAEGHVSALVQDLFEVADELNVQADKRRGFGSLASNDLRIHWLLNNLLRDRFDLSFRTQIVRNASISSSLEWLVSISSRCKSILEDREIGRDDGHGKLVDDEATNWLWQTSLQRLERAASDGTLKQHPSLIALLFRWRDRAGADKVREWTDAQLGFDDFVVAVARDAVAESWSHGMGWFGGLGDRVAQRTEYVHLEPLAPLLDLSRFRERVRAIHSSGQVSPSDMAIIDRFQATPERDPSSPG